MTWLKNKKKIFLAGGINETNVKRAISQVAPDVIDLSSAVEKTSEDGTFHGKDPEKIRTIVTMVHDWWKDFIMQNKKYGEYGGQYVEESMMSVLA